MRPSIRLIARATVASLAQHDAAMVTPATARLLLRYGYHRQLELFSYHLKREYAKRFNVLVVDTILARPQTDTRLANIESSISQLLGLKVAMNIIIDPHILGGIVLETPDKYLDASSRGALMRLA